MMSSTRTMTASEAAQGNNGPDVEVGELIIVKGNGKEIVATCQGFRWLQSDNRYEVKYTPLSDYILHPGRARPEDCYHLPKVDEIEALVELARAQEAELAAMREYFGALQGGYYLDGYDAMRAVNGHDAPSPSTNWQSAALDYRDMAHELLVYASFDGQHHPKLEARIDALETKLGDALPPWPPSDVPIADSTPPASDSHTAAADDDSHSPVAARLRALERDNANLRRVLAHLGHGEVPDLSMLDTRPLTEAEIARGEALEADALAALQAGLDDIAAGRGRVQLDADWWSREGDIHVD